MEAYEWSFRKRWRNFKWKVKFAASRNSRLSVICAVVLSAVFLLSCFLWQRKVEDPPLLLTYSTHETAGLRLLENSVRGRGFEFRVLGLGDTWINFSENKIKTMRRELAKYQDDDERIVLFSDANDVLFLGDARSVVDKFRQFHCKILVSAEIVAWPPYMEPKYPNSNEYYKHLNSGLYMGYASYLYRFLSDATYPLVPDDQEHLTRIYLDDELRRRLDIRLDHRAEIFQSLHQAVEDTELRFRGRQPYVHNRYHETTPLVVHANGPSKAFLNLYSNFFPAEWNPVDGCLTCLQDTKNLNSIQAELYPTIVVGVFIDEPSTEFLRKLTGQSYPKHRMHLVIADLAGVGQTSLAALLADHAKEYAGVRFCQDPEEKRCRLTAVEACVEIECGYYLHVDADAHLDNALALRLLVEQNRPVVAPLLANSNTANFRLASLTMDNAHIPDSFTGFVENRRRGLWRVQWVSKCYLIRGDVVLDEKTRPSYDFHRNEFHHEPFGSNEPYDLAFSRQMTRNHIDLFVSNRFDFGSLH